MGNTFRSKQHRSRKQKETLLNRLFNKYKIDAKRRGLIFEIEFSDFHKLIKSNCYLCGSPPTGKFKRSESNAFITFTGLDRVDNKLGYTLENCKPACKTCNFMKSDLEPKTFKNQIRKIFTFGQRLKFGSK